MIASCARLWPLPLRVELDATLRNACRGVPRPGLQQVKTARVPASLHSAELYAPSPDIAVTSPLPHCDQNIRKRADTPASAVCSGCGWNTDTHSISFASSKIEHRPSFPARR